VVWPNSRRSFARQTISSFHRLGRTYVPVVVVAEL
jgi:hypothetical protein